MSTKAPILLKFALRWISSGKRNCPNPPVGPKTRTEVSAIFVVKRTRVAEGEQETFNFN